MIAFRTLLAIALTCLGTYYAFVSLQVLVNVSEVTSRWIHLSGDLDFRFDADLFRALIGSGAAAVLAFGLVTVICGIRTASGRFVSCNYWIGLAIAAPLIFPWLTYKVIATGKRPGWELSVRSIAIRFILICAAYIVAWVLTRPQPQTRH